MKLTSEDVTALKTLLNVCQMGSVDSFLIEDGVARGLNEPKTFAIISDRNIPGFGKNIGITRANVLKSRIDVFNGKDVCINAIESSRNEISSLEIISGRNKVQFRCASTMLFDKKVPRAINDLTAFAFTISLEDAKSILDAVRVMGAKQVVLHIDSDKNAVTIEMSDATNEIFTVTIHSDVIKDGAEDTATVCYAADVFCSVLKNIKDDVIPFLIGAKGTLKAVVLGHEIVILPQIMNFND